MMKMFCFYTLIKDGWPAGFFMLDYREKQTCNLSFLGLVEEAIGLGLGDYLFKDGYFNCLG